MKRLIALALAASATAASAAPVHPVACHIQRPDGGYTTVNMTFDPDNNSLMANIGGHARLRFTGLSLSNDDVMGFGNVGNTLGISLIFDMHTGGVTQVVWNAKTHDTIMVSKGRCPL